MNPQEFVRGYRESPPRRRRKRTHDGISWTVPTAFSEEKGCFCRSCNRMWGYSSLGFRLERTTPSNPWRILWDCRQCGATLRVQVLGQRGTNGTVEGRVQGSTQEGIRDPTEPLE